MRKTLTLFVPVVLLCCATVALAQDPWWEDNVGIIDVETEVPCGFPGAGYGNAYLVLHHMSCPNGVAAWECRLAVSGDVTITEVVHGMAVDADSDILGFAVGLAEVIPYQPRFVVLAEIEYASFGGQGELYVYPNRTPSIPGTAVYVDGADAMHQIPMHPAGQTWDAPAFAVNYCIIVDTIESTWGAVKGLYR